MPDRKISQSTLKTLLMGSTLLMGLAVGNVAAAQDSADSAVQEVVVTGSRIVRRDLVAASPLVTVTSETFENRATVAIENALNQLPQFTPGGNAFGLNASNVQAGAQATIGAATLNLRGLGANRNLVLIDGRRPQPSNAALIVDINSIPPAAVASVEVVSGGASATYGADAIAGVVNFKLKQNFQGLDVDAQYGRNQQGDGQEYQISALMGANFADDRGNVMMGASWSKRDPVYQRSRDFYVNGFTDLGTSGGFGRLGSYGYAQFTALSFQTGAAAGPTQAVVDSIFATKGFAPGTVSAGTSFGVNPNGTIFAPAPQSGRPAPGYSGPLLPRYKILTSGADAGFLDQNINVDEGFVSLPMERYSVFSNGHYKINDHITAFAQGMYTGNKTETVLGAAPSVQFWGTDVPGDYGVGGLHQLPGGPTGELARLLASRPNPNAPWALAQDTFTGPRHTKQTGHTFQVTVGLRGDLPINDWTWEVYGSHGQNSQIIDYDRGWVSQQKLQAVIAAPNYGRGVNFTSQAALSTPGFGGTCTSGLYDSVFFGAAPSADCVELISLRMKTTSDLRQDIAEATVQGKLFDLPAGELRFAAGADYRKASFEFLPDSNLTAASIRQQPIGLFGSGAAIGSTNVKEIYGEVLAPILADMPGVKKLELELGYRYSDYDTVGGQGTYKALATWDVIDIFRLRGGYQKATRAPNIAELYTGPAQAVVGYTGDPCSSIFLGTYGVSAANTNATARANARTLCSALINPVAPGYNPDTYVGFFANGPFTIDEVRGNRNVGAETAKTWTVGAVIRSPATSGIFSRLSASVDWYNIKIVDAISPATSNLSYQQCFNADGASNAAFGQAGATAAALRAGNPLCANILRETGSGFARYAYSPYTNLGGIKTSGLDVQVDWRMDFEDLNVGIPGGFSVNFVMNYLNSWRLQGSPGAKYNEYVGTTGNINTGGTQFRYKTFTTFTYFAGPVSAGIRWMHLPSVRNGDTVLVPTLLIQGAKSYDNLDLFGTWNINRTLTLRGGIDNLLNRDPNIVGYNPGVTNSAGVTNTNYDPLGRRFYVGLKARF